MNTIKLTAISFVATAFLVGCASTSDDAELQTGYFIDSEVVGVEYETTSGVNGITDSSGKFQYNDGDIVKFSLGHLVLGECKPASDGLITPKSLVVGDDSTPTTEEEETIMLMLQTLQSLDSDGDSSNGITISSSVLDDLENLSEDIHFHTLDEASLIELENSYDLGLDEDNDGSLDVDEEDAKTHFESSNEEWEKGNRPDNDEHGEGTEDDEHKEFVLEDYPITENMTQDLKNSLAYMGNEERLAYDVYMNLYNFHTNDNNLEIKQFKNIAEKSEIKHVGIVQSLVQRYNLGADDLSDVSVGVAENNVTFEDMPSGKYDIASIQTLYNTLYDLGIQSQENALKVGCMVEVTDIEDLDKYIVSAEDSNATDVVEAFNVLRDGSYSHYWSFDKGLKNLGITEGCYVEGDTLLTNKDGVYPQNEKGHNDEESSNNGNGNRNGKH